jgi:hypothetical protein
MVADRSLLGHAVPYGRRASAIGKGHTVSKTIFYQMDAEAARATRDDLETQRLNPGEPDPPSAPRGPLNNLDQLVNWSHDFLNRNQDGRVYPILGNQETPAGARDEIGNQGMAYENARGGRVSNL